MDFESPLAAALSYAKLGWHVMPIEASGKKPLTTNGLNDATLDVQKIQEWWQRWPGANVGVRTGSPSDVVALDIDPRHGGDVSLELLVDRLGALPDTVQALTGGGGRHILFQMPVGPLQGFNDGRLGAGFDLKSSGGYIVVAPSRHESGKLYSWEGSCVPGEQPLGRLPDGWLSELRKPKPRVAKAGAPGGEVYGAGQRNAALARQAGALRRVGMSENDIFESVWKINLERCKPPLDEREVRTLAGSIARYAPEETSAETPLQEVVDEILVSKDVPHIKKRRVVKQVLKSLQGRGTFYVDELKASSEAGATVDSCYYFDSENKSLARLDSNEFKNLVYRASGLVQNAPEFSSIMSSLQSEAGLDAMRTRVRESTHYDEVAKMLYVHRGDNRVYVCDGKDIRLEDNGVNGVLFKRDRDENAWEADLHYEGEPLFEMVDMIEAEEGALSAEERRLLLAVFIVAMAFPDIQADRLIPVFVGPTGSGKTMTSRRIGQFWRGPDWQVTKISEKAQDAQVALCESTFVCLDNVDSRVDWLADMICTAATGGKFQSRMLYTNGAIYEARIKAFMTMTSIEGRWIKREDTVTRFLPVPMKRRFADNISEHQLLKGEMAQRGRRMGHMLILANGVVKALRAGATPGPTPLRIADFAFVGGLIAAEMGRTALFVEACRKLPEEQQRFFYVDHPIIEILEEWIMQYGMNRDVPIDEMYEQCAKLGGWGPNHGIRSARGMIDRMGKMRDEIDRRVGPYEVKRDTQKRVTVIFYPIDSLDAVRPVEEQQGLGF